MTPKSLLRHPEVSSPLSAFSNDTFHEILIDHAPKKKDAEVLLMCSGKIYYELKSLNNQAYPLVRLEQLYPFPKANITDLLKQYPKLKEIRWVQEEPANMGAWSFVRPRIENLIKNQKIVVNYIGRKHSGSTAEGYLKAHKIEQERILSVATADVADCGHDQSD
jgi:2-oxoglutarate dehydrogenase E1 component